MSDFDTTVDCKRICLEAPSTHTFFSLENLKTIFVFSFFFVLFLLNKPFPTQKKDVKQKKLI